MVVIMYCPKGKYGNHNWEIDKSSNGLLLRCRNCNFHIVTLPKKVYKKIEKYHKKERRG